MKENTLIIDRTAIEYERIKINPVPMVDCSDGRLEFLGVGSYKIEIRASQKSRDLFPFTAAYITVNPTEFYRGLICNCIELLPNGNIKVLYLAQERKTL